VCACILTHLLTHSHTYTTHSHISHTHSHTLLTHSHTYTTHSHISHTHSHTHRREEGQLRGRCQGHQGGHGPEVRPQLELYHRCVCVCVCVFIYICSRMSACVAVTVHSTFTTYTPLTHSHAYRRGIRVSDFLRGENACVVCVRCNV
jgi:hypothetical protein